MEKLIELYKKWAGEEPADVIKLAGQGSNRQYFRIIRQDGDTVIGVIGTSRDEDHAFVYLAQHFQLRQLPVPQILAVSDDELCYLQTDLGGTSLFDAIKGGRDAGGRYNQKEKELLKKTIRELPNIQIRGARGLDWQNCYPQPEFDVDSVLFRSQILAVSDDELCYLQTDLGGTSLFDAIKGGRDAGGRYNQKEKELLKKTIRELPNIQIREIGRAHCRHQIQAADSSSASPIL